MPSEEQGSPGSLGTFLSALRALPLWLLVGLALTGWVTTIGLLLAQSIGGTDLGVFRQQWGVWLLIGAVGFTLFALARGVDIGVAAYSRRSKAEAQRQILRLVHLDQQSWWHLAKQRDDTFMTQVSLACQVSNTTDRPVQIAKVRLISPRASVVDALTLLPSEGSPYHSSRHVVPAHGTVAAIIHLMVRGALRAQGRPLKISIGVVDQFGEEYRLPNLKINTHDRPMPRPSMAGRLRIVRVGARNILERLHLISPPPPAAQPTMPWTYEPGFEYLEPCLAILREEKRSYAARGRISGQLGTMNVGLQSEPNFGWTKVGEVPVLLWEKGQTKRLSSPNLDRLLKIWNSLGPSEQTNLGAFLLTHLRKDSEFADIGYFLFLGLHRMDRTIDALKTARTCLSGDKVFGVFVKSCG